MSSRLAVTEHSAGEHSAGARKRSAAKPVATIRLAVREDAAANDDTPKSSFAIFGDPLWGMAIASGILFVVLAALMAIG